ncbi:hypothetical protein [Microbispora sp. NBC_01389]|uniref:hypothetical protein n=1 Tax=Microbispora sp. NBC_01389 TaxID=2903584 RepID=UPI0032542C31
MGMPLRRDQPPNLDHLRAVRQMSVGRYRTCPTCNGFCYLGRDPNRCPIPCRTCSATGRIYVKARK